MQHLYSLAVQVDQLLTTAHLAKWYPMTSCAIMVTWRLESTLWNLIYKLLIRISLLKKNGWVDLSRHFLSICFHSIQTCSLFLSTERNSPNSAAEFLERNLARGHNHPCEGNWIWSPNSRNVYNYLQFRIKTASIWESVSRSEPNHRISKWTRNA